MCRCAATAATASTSCETGDGWPLGPHLKARIERELDPDAIERMKQSLSSDIGIGGAELAGQAIVAGLVDELHLLLVPVLVGGGKRALPNDVHARLDLLDERRFQSGTVFLRYRARR